MIENSVALTQYDAEMQTVWLNAKESEAFAEALLNPREPNARLKAAARRYLKLTGGQ